MTAIEEIKAALEQIAGLEPSKFAMPPDWNEQIAACSECQRYKGHPIQNGICDTHRRPLWDRERHGDNEREAIGYRAKHIASAALSRLAELEKAEPVAELRVDMHGGSYFYWLSDAVFEPETKLYTHPAAAPQNGAGYYRAMLSAAPKEPTHSDGVQTPDGEQR